MRALALRLLDRYPLLQAAQRSPCIVNVSSVAGVSSTGSGAIYAMSTAIAFRCHSIRQHSRECGNSALHPIRADLAGRRHAAQSTTRGTPRRAAGESVRMKRVCAAASAAFPPHTARRCASVARSAQCEVTSAVLLATAEAGVRRALRPEALLAGLRLGVRTFGRPRKRCFVRDQARLRWSS